jgi:[ribosomal protein S18]-alanine N-acetyltransferase
MNVRRAIPTDIPAMSQLHRDASANPWSRGQYESLFKTTASEQTGYFMLVAEDPFYSESVAESASTSSLIAHLVAHHVLGEWQLQYVVVGKQYQGRGIGTHLLEEFISFARDSGAGRISLEVRESNQRARQMYKRVGFRETGLRKGYYPDPPEHAILYELSL